MTVDPGNAPCIAAVSARLRELQDYHNQLTIKYGDLQETIRKTFTQIRTIEYQMEQLRKALEALGGEAPKNDH